MERPQRAESYRGLDAWKKGMRLASVIYRMTSAWPAEERYGMTSQIRRAAVSIPSNVAEGQGRLGKAEMRHHLSMAHGSLCEVETLLFPATEIGFLPAEERDALLAESGEVGRILRGFIRSLDGNARNLPEPVVNPSARLLDTSTHD